MKRENRKPSAREWAAITSRRPVVRRIPKPRAEGLRQREAGRLDRIATEQPDAHLEDEDLSRRWKPTEGDRK